MGTAEDAFGKLIGYLIVAGLIIAAVFFIIVYVLLPILMIMFGAGAVCGLGCSGWNFANALKNNIGVRSNV